MPNEKQEDSWLLCVSVTKQPLGGPDGPHQASAAAPALHGERNADGHVLLLSVRRHSAQGPLKAGAGGSHAFWRLCEELWWPRTHAWAL